MKEEALLGNNGDGGGLEGGKGGFLLSTGGDGFCCTKETITVALLLFLVGMRLRRVGRLGLIRMSPSIID
jgi:hypothetical protein